MQNSGILKTFHTGIRAKISPPTVDWAPTPICPVWKVN